MRRLRVTHVTVQPHLVWDDGDNLSPGPTTQPVDVALADLPGVPASILAQLAGVETSENSEDPVSD